MAIPDDFQGMQTSWAAPYREAFAITKSDSVALTWLPRAIYVGGAGDLVVRFPGSAVDITFKAPPVGTVLEIRPEYVMAATTATLLLALR
jgi:hypothetical protein